MNKVFVSMLFLVACQKAILAGPTEEAVVDESVVECTAITTCNGVSTLLPLLVPLLPQGPQGQAGLTGQPGKDASVEDVVAAVLPLLPSGPQGDVGSQGPAGQSVSLTDVVSAVLPLLPIGPQGAVGLQGPQGLQGVAGSQGQLGPQGAKGDKGEQGVQGPAGVGLSNVSTLSAVRVYSPAVLDFKGVIGVNSLAVFVPRSLKVVEGSQGVGFATLEFGTNVCTYQGNNKSIDANAAYVLTNCKDAGGATLPNMVPGKPFAFTGSITLSIGVGADTAEATQAVAYLQVN